MTIWSSDSCKCIIEIDDVTMKIKNIVQKCTSHNDVIGADFIGSQAHQLNYNHNTMNGNLAGAVLTATQLTSIQTTKATSYLASKIA